MFHKYLLSVLVLCLIVSGCYSSNHIEDPVPLQSFSIKFRNKDDIIRIPIRQVAIAGDFNEWSQDKNALNDDDADGLWTITLNLKPGQYKYMFVVNSFMWVSPPDALEYIDDGFGNLNGILEIKNIQQIIPK